MRCSRVRRLLHLDREGEMEKSLRERVLRHASACPGCAAELERIRKTEGRYASLRNATPVLADPDRLTAAVMDRVIREQTGPAWIDWLGKRTFPVAPGADRAGLRMAAAAAVALFLFQSLHDAGKMADLDRRLAAEPGASLARYEEAVRHAGLFRDLRIGPPGSTALMERLRERYGALFAVTAEDGLDQRERRILATEGRAFLDELEDLVNLAEGNDGH